MPNVSLCVQENELHYNPLPYQGFCKLTLNDGTTVEIEGSGELTKAMVSDQYKGTLVSAEIGELCTSIGNSTFAFCNGLTSITIPNSVTSIGNGAFGSCSSLTNITIPNSVTSIKTWAFQYCESLTSVTIPDSVTNIDGGVFQGCSNLSTITSHIMNAPSVNPGTFANVKNGGTLYVPIGSNGYDTWMNNQGNLGLYNWKKVEQ